MQVFGGYVIDENELYAGYIFLKTDTYKIYKYNGKTFEDSGMDSAKSKEFLKKKIPYSDAFMDEQTLDMRKIAGWYAGEIPMDIASAASEIFSFDGTVISLRYAGEGLYDLFKTKDGVEENVLGKKYWLGLRQDYVYVDETYKKIYFYGLDVENKTQGIFVYDIVNSVITPVAVRKNKDSKKGEYFEPIRIPGTAKLLFVARESPLNRKDYVKSNNLCTIEIKEWQDEIKSTQKAEKR